MTQYDKDMLVNKLVLALGQQQVLTDEPMSAHTTFKIGGPADLYVVPRSTEDMQTCLELVKEAAAPYFVLGLGSDLLVSDAGFRGVIIAAGDGLKFCEHHGNVLECGAGVSLKEATDKALELGLGGFEFACGIPGSVGGACFMNAGAYGGTIQDVLKSVLVITPTGELTELGVDELALGYRTSRIKTDGLVVVRASFELTPHDSREIKARMDDLTRQREEKQPLEYGSAGSTFKRPEGHFAGKLITDAGLKGYRVGDAQVSLKHAGFVVNLNHATAADVHAVIEHVQAEVKRQFGVDLEPEVRFLG
ncbi:MAG: UDP-N-acetylmuramate dehydrogenase [Atopobiaceae bacterium]|jgi:UDP-N-acetylmuramate dehydrogenase